jgi:hypothetical protein
MNNLNNAILSQRKEKMYKTDKMIELEFNNYKILSIDKTSDDSGYIEINFPNGGESVGGGSSLICDRWIKYPFNNKIAFDHWYPARIYLALCIAINNKFYQ